MPVKRLRILRECVLLTRVCPFKTCVLVMMMGFLFNPVMTIGGSDSSVIVPSLAMKRHSFICFVLPKSTEKAERVENCERSIMLPVMSVAPKDVSKKWQSVRFE